MKIAGFLCDEHGIDTKKLSRSKLIYESAPSVNCLKLIDSLLIYKSNSYAILYV